MKQKLRAPGAAFAVQGDSVHLVLVLGEGLDRGNRAAFVLDGGVGEPEFLSPRE
jgi:hypothetical protein